MEPVDICYTPLDVPAFPNIDIELLRDWVIKSIPNVQCSLGDYARNSLGDQYPWTPAFPYLVSKGGWMYNFENEFPELTKYFTEAFGIDVSDLGSISMIPLKEGKTGLGFWHTDSDLFGLRMYLQNDDYEKNPLLYRKTVEPITERPQVKVPMDENDGRFEKETHVCKLLAPQQAFYINNIRGVHSPLITTPTNRIAVLISGRPNEKLIYEKTKKLIVDSANKYKDYALFY